MGELIKGRPIADKILAQVKNKVKNLKRKGVQTKLGIIFVGKDKPSQTYIRKKQEAALSVGMDCVLYHLPTTIGKDKLIAFIKKIQTDKKMHGLIIQLPLPEKLYKPEVLNAINPEIDVDCLTDTNLGKLVMRTNWLTPPTPEAVMRALAEIRTKLMGKNITIVGTGSLVGKPLAIMLANEGASVTTCNSRTNNTPEKCRMADIIVSAVGKKDLIRGDMIANGATVIDTGIAFENGKMFGDVNREEVMAKAKYLTPTPGGIGPITVALLLYNTTICAERAYKSTHRKTK